MPHPERSIADAMAMSASNPEQRRTVTEHDWHAVEASLTTERLQVDPARGLDAGEVAARLTQYGPNRTTTRAGRSAPVRFLLQCVQHAGASSARRGGISAFLGEWGDATVIIGVVLINAIVGFIQEGKAESALAALARVIAAEASVTRNARRHRIDATHLVPGGVVHLGAGDKVPADLRLIGGRELRTAEVALTGES
ncbi:MAG: hypothetical protein JSR28_03225 [Proteobacteria bacterium]|nr:hypothetical protein [Pseudomonadota bacterium]